MLYVTTRNNCDTYTVYHALKHDRGPDGGLFVPFRCPVFSKDEVATCLSLPFDECTARILNRFLGLQLTGWDISFYVGRYPVRVKGLGYRTFIAEGWHNPEWCFDRVVRNLAQLLDQDGISSQWLNIAVRAAVFAALCGEVQRMGIAQPIDIASASGNFYSPMAAWYARQIGFPIGNIICCCNENGNLWELLANGQMRTDGISTPTILPEADIVIPDGLEQLIHACGGTAEVLNYVDACQRGGIYYPSDAVLAKLRDGIYVSVVGSRRVMQTIPSVFNSRYYLLSPYDALCYCGVQDYRSRFGETGAVLIFSEWSASCHKSTVAGAMDISEEEIEKFFK